MNTLRALTATWRKEALIFRRYGEERLAIACETHADELEAAAATTRIEAVSLEEAAEIGRNLSTTMGHSTGLIKEQFPVWRGVWWED